MTQKKALPEWIPIESELPNDYQEVMAIVEANDGIHVLHGQYCDDVDPIPPFQFYSSTVKKGIVHYWLPLPKIPDTIKDKQEHKTHGK